MKQKQTGKRLVLRNYTHWSEPCERSSGLTRRNGIVFTVVLTGQAERTWTFSRPVWAGRTNAASLSSLTKLPEAPVRPQRPWPGRGCPDRVQTEATSRWFEAAVLTEVLHAGNLPLTSAVSPAARPMPSLSQQSKGCVLHEWDMGSSQALRVLINSGT